MRQKLRKMLFFIFIFQIEEQSLYFFPSRIRYGVFNVYNLKKIREKRSNITITNDEYVRGDTTFGTDISHRRHVSHIFDKTNSAKAILTKYFIFFENFSVESKLFIA